MRHAIGTLMLAAALLGGCDRMEMWSPSRSYNAPAAAQSAPPAPAYTPPPRAVVPAPREVQGETAVDTALAWAQKHAEVSAKLAASERENRQLSEKNQVLQLQLDQTKGQLAAAQKELGEANGMMKELEARLAKWQENVLGYRQEMREAQKAQMEALTRVIKLLGGEVSASAPVSAGPAGASGREVRHVTP